ncbi:mRNA interferase YafQ [Rhizobium sullae]|uniref:mRNA interferase YafQ n=2 Tax=Rhizobium sullae TaxID=50338 RepID=A0A4R3PXH1_RHISU|nr:mRNA interferase YafQ [Rhizobium sullae]
MDMNRVIELMMMIILKTPLEAEWADHELSGKEWKGAREAHIGGDFLLVYDADDDFVEFVRLGTHSELFGR